MTARLRRGVAVLAAVAVLLTLGVAAPAATASQRGPDDTLCRMDTSRGALPSKFPLRVCTDGKKLYLVNDLEFPVKVSLSPNVTATVSPTPKSTLAGSLTSFYSRQGMLPPEYELTVAVPDQGLKVNVAPASAQAGKTYLWAKYLLDYAPTRAFGDLYAIASEAISVTVDLDPCLASHGWLGDIGCIAGATAKLTVVIASAAIDTRSVGGMLALVGVGLWARAAGNDGIAAWVDGVRDLALKPIASSTAKPQPGDNSTTKPPAGTSTTKPPTGTSSTPAKYSVLADPCLDLHDGAGHTAPKIGCIPKGNVVSIRCTTTSNSVTGPYGASSLWDRVSYGGRTGFIADAWVYTGTAKAAAPTCSSPTTAPPPPAPPPPAPSATGKVSISPCLDLHSSAGHTAPVTGCIPNGTVITIECTVTSNSVTGPWGTTSLWDRTTWNGMRGFVTDAYVYTGTAAAVAPHC